LRWGSVSGREEAPGRRVHDQDRLSDRELPRACLPVRRRCVHLDPSLPPPACEPADGQPAPSVRRPPLLGRARRASPHRRRTLDSGARGTAAVEGRRGKSSPKLVKCPLGERAFSGPRQGTDRVLALRPGSGDRSVRVWVQDPRRGRAKREADPPRTYKNPSPLPCAGKRRRAASARRGRGCGGLGDAGDPACSGGRRRGRPRSGRPQAPLELVWKVLTAAFGGPGRPHRRGPSAELGTPWPAPGEQLGKFGWSTQNSLPHGSRMTQKSKPRSC
jgi:hypothetical protein